MSEATFWKSIRPNLQEIGQFSRIESPITAEGYPDLCGVIEGVSNQIELKFIGSQTHGLKKNFFRLSQHVWFRDRLKHYDDNKGPFVLTQIQGSGLTIHRGKTILKLKDIRNKEDWVACAEFLYTPDIRSWRFFKDVFMGKI